MNPHEIDAQALKFKRLGNAEFDPLVRHYRSTCNKWFKHVYRYTRVDREEFNAKFYLLLYRSLQKYNPDFTQCYDVVDSKFDRYFLAAVRKLSITYRRSSARSQKKQQASRIDDLDIAINIDPGEMVYIEDFIAQLKNKTDQEIVRLRVFGNSRQDVCECLHLKLHEYRARINRIKRHPSIVSLLTST